MMWVKQEDLTEDEKAGIDNDPVVKEVKVYLSKALQDKLYLVQYPLRPDERKFEEEQILEAKIKPEQDKIQLTFGVDTTSKRYDRHVGARMKAEQTGVKNPNEEEDCDSDYDETTGRSRNLYDEFVLESTETSKSSRYVLGTVRPEGLFITPFKAIVQMRPSFEHLDKAVAQMTKSAKKTAESADSAEEEIEDEPTKVTVKFNQTRTGAAAGAGRGRNSKTYSAMAKMKEEEPWVKVEFNKKNQDPTYREYSKLFSGNHVTNDPFYVIKPEEYKNSVMPKHFEIDVETPLGEKKKTTQVKSTRQLNVNQLNLLSFGEQLKTIMRNAGVLSYAQIDNYLRTKLGCSCDDKTLLRAIQIVATLVQGCWVVRSDLIFSPDYKSGAHGISANIMQKARDAILHEFVENRWVDRKRMCALTHLPTEEVTEILSKIAERKMKPGKVSRYGWEFRLPYDSNFVANHPDVVQRQMLMLEKIIANKARTRSSGSDSGDGGSDASDKEVKYKPPIPVPMTTTSPPRRRRSSRNKSTSESESEMVDSKDNVFRKPVGQRKRNSSSSSQNATNPPEEHFHLLTPKTEPDY